MLNGGGYPKTLFGRSCHKASTLVHVCDVFDALRTRRPYREAWEQEKALTYLEERAGSEFDPDVAGPFVKMMRGLEGKVLRATGLEGEGPEAQAPRAGSADSPVVTAAPVQTAAPPQTAAPERTAAPVPTEVPELTLIPVMAPDPATSKPD
jgi:hypothetical protein